MNYFLFLSIFIYLSLPLLRNPEDEFFFFLNFKTPQSALELMGDGEAACCLPSLCRCLQQQHALYFYFLC